MSYYPNDHYIRDSNISLRSLPTSTNNTGYGDYNYLKWQPVTMVKHTAGQPPSSSLSSSGYSSSLIGTRPGRGGVWRDDRISGSLNNALLTSYQSLPTVAKASHGSYHPTYGYVQSSNQNHYSTPPARNVLTNKSRSQYDLSSVLSEGRYHERPKFDDDEDEEISYRARNGDNNRGRNGTLISGSCAGLLNLGNTCFMNSILQCLANTRPLVSYFLNKDYKRDMVDQNWYLVQAFAEVLHALWSKRHPFAPDNFRYEIGLSAKAFAGYSQHDAQEFLIYLLQRLSEDLNRVQQKKQQKKPDTNGSSDLENISGYEKAQKLWEDYVKAENSIISDLFMGQLKSQLKCGECGYKSNTFDPCLGFSLPIKKSYGFQESTLLDCFELYSQDEKLDGHICEKCKKKQKSTKQLSINRFPQILIIHLKRFSKSHFGHSKLSAKVKCPMVLDLSRFSSSYKMQDAFYNLYAVCSHTGTVSSGHYTATAKSHSTQKWYLYDDDKVFSIPESRAVSAEGAYILFYELSSSFSLAL